MCTTRRQKTNLSRPTSKLVIMKFQVRMMYYKHWVGVHPWS